MQSTANTSETLEPQRPPSGLTSVRALEGRSAEKPNKDLAQQGLSPTANALHVVNGHDIYMKELPPTKWYIGNILQEGVCLLSGDPKVGKSFLALQIAIAVAGTGETACGSFQIGQHGRVLYLALDDGSEKRIRERLRQLTSDEEAVKQIDFVYQRNLPSLSKGFDEILDQYLSRHKYELVVLDTFGAVLEPTNTKNVYRMDYQEAIKLQKLAQKHGICLLALHHTNKGEGKDATQRASGSHGLTGAVDSVLLLTGDRLIARPRDGEESEHSLERQSDGSWQTRNGALARKPDSLWQIGEDEDAFGTPPFRRLNREQQAVRDALAAGPKDRPTLAKELGLTDEAMRKRLERMAKAKLVTNLPGRRYEWAGAEAIPASPAPGETGRGLDTVSVVSQVSECPSCPSD